MNSAMSQKFLRRAISYVHKHFRLILVSSFSLYGLYLRIITLARREFSADEMFQLTLLKQPSFLQFVRELPLYEYCTYLSGDYILLYPFFRIFNNNKWGLAIPHMIITIFGFYLLYLVCKRYLKTTLGYLIVFAVAAFNINLVNHALEMRVYAVLPTLSLACLYFSQSLSVPQVTFAKKLAIGFFFILTIWFHVYCILILFFTLFFSLWEVRHSREFKLIFKKAFKSMAVILAIAMPLWFISVFGSPHTYQQVDTFEYIANPLKDALGFFKGILANLIGYRYKKLYFLLLGLIFPLLIPYRNRVEQLSFLILLVAAPIIIILLSDLKNSYWFIQRQFIWTIPFFAVFLGWVWESAVSWLFKQ